MAYRNTGTRVSNRARGRVRKRRQRGGSLSPTGAISGPGGRTATGARRGAGGRRRATSGGGGGSVDTPFRKRYHERRRRIRKPYQGKGGPSGPGMGNQTMNYDMYGNYIDPYNEEFLHKQPGGQVGMTSRGGRGPSGAVVGTAGTVNQETMIEITDCIGGCGSTFEDGHVEYGKDCMKNCTDKILW